MRDPEPETEHDDARPPGKPHALRRTIEFLSRRRSMRGWYLVGAALAVGGLIAGATDAGRSPLQREIVRVQADLASSLDVAASEKEQAESDIQNLEWKLADAMEEIARAEEEAESAYARALDKVRKELSGRSDKLDERAKGLDKWERELKQREQAVGVAERTIERNSFANGRFKVGTDIRPGTYRTDGGSGCYWAKLSASDGSDIISNHFGSGPQTLVIDSPWFESQGCGTWVPA